MAREERMMHLDGTHPVLRQSPEEVFFYQSDPGSQPGCTCRRYQTCGAGSNDYEIIAAGGFRVPPFRWMQVGNQNAVVLIHWQNLWNVIRFHRILLGCWSPPARGCSMAFT